MASIIVIVKKALKGRKEVLCQKLKFLNDKLFLQEMERKVPLQTFYETFFLVSFSHFHFLFCIWLFLLVFFFLSGWFFLVFLSFL